jgi:hypothetical protein
LRQLPPVTMSVVVADEEFLSKWVYYVFRAYGILKAFRKF